MKVNGHSRLILISLCIAALTASPVDAQKSNAPGVTDTEIKVGQTMPYSGPASAWGAVGRAELAYFKMINERGGIKGRKISLLSLDDGFSPPKTVEQTRKLVERDGVAFIFNSLGPGNEPIREYLNEHRVPQLFIQAPMERFNDPQHYPWTVGLLPTFYREGYIHARYILAHKPEAKIAILHANDDSARKREGSAGWSRGKSRQADREGAVLRGERSDCRVADRIVKGFRCRYILRSRLRKIRVTSDSQSQRDRLEAASFPILWLPVDLRGAAAGWIGEFGGYHFSPIF